MRRIHAMSVLTKPVPHARRGHDVRRSTARAQVDRGMQQLRDEVRAADDYRALVPRTAWEAVYDAAPGPARFEA